MAMGKAPSKDTFWSSNNGAQATTRGGCDKTGCPADHSTPAAELHTALAVLSTGPVGFSDAPNETDATLLMRTCDSAGNLLQPSRPITSVDSTQSAVAAEQPKGRVLCTHTAIAPSSSSSSVAVAAAGPAPVEAALYIVLGHQLTQDYTLLLRDLWPAPATPAVLTVAGSLNALRACSAGSAAAACGLAQLPLAPGAPSTTPLLTLPMVPAGVDAFTPHLALLARTCPGSSPGAGLGFLGEAEKFAPVSVQRFLALDCTVQGSGEAELQLTLAGQPGESVALTWVQWQGAAQGTVRTGVHQFPGAAKGLQQVDCTVAGDSLTCA